MRFESRDLKPYAEYVPTNALKQGATYFYIRFIDNDLLVPVLEAFVFVGRNLEAEDERKVYFQDAASFFSGVRIDTEDINATGSTDGRAVLYSFPDDKGHVFEYDRALDVLLTCALKRKARDLQ
jgi:hypothetical protein